jgi:hypothetical protein
MAEKSEIMINCRLCIEKPNIITTIKVKRLE